MGTSKPNSRPLALAQPGGTSAAEADKQVRALLDAGKCKQAVELAKENHKCQASAESEQLLVDAYLGRIEHFQSKGAAEDAETLIKLVRERFPKHAGLLVKSNAEALAAQGKFDELLAPLATGNATDQERELIESAIRRRVIDLPALAGCPTLPADHPLRVSASAIYEALKKVTTAPVADDQISLPMVSRRSPLADWKLLVRALSAFYRKDDAASRKAMEAIASDSAAARMIPALKPLLESTPAPAGLCASLQGRVIADDRPLHEALQALDSAFTSYEIAYLQQAIRAAVAACESRRPEILELLRQRIAARCVACFIPTRVMLNTLGVPRLSASFWRMAARALDYERLESYAVWAWERFLKHAIAEHMFASNGNEAAIVYLKMAELSAERLDEFDERDRDEAEAIASCRAHLRDFCGTFYPRQAPAIAALQPDVKSIDADRSDLSTGSLFRQAAVLMPDAETFQRWLAWGRESEIPERKLQAIGELWREKLPADPQAPLLLSDLAEKRKALKQALTYLDQAEALDSMNPSVRRARLRLTLATLWRHLREHKLALAEADLKKLREMPATHDRDRRGMLLAVEVAIRLMQSQGAPPQGVADALVEQVGPILATPLLAAVREAADLPAKIQFPRIEAPVSPEPLAIAEASARLSALEADLQLPVEHPRQWEGPIRIAIRERPCRLSTQHLLALGRWELSAKNWAAAYHVSSAGLQHASGALAARFLLLRAQSLAHETFTDRRMQQCFRAALEVARQANDAELLSEVSAAIQSLHPWTKADILDAGALGPEVLGEVLKQERLAEKFPAGRDEAERFVVAVDADRRSSRRGRGFGASPEDDPFGFADDDDDEESDDDDNPRVDFSSVPTDIPPDAADALQQVLERTKGAPTLDDLNRMDPGIMAKLISSLFGVKVDAEAIRESQNAANRGKRRK